MHEIGDEDDRHLSLRSFTLPIAWWSPDDRDRKLVEAKDFGLVLERPCIAALLCRPELVRGSGAIFDFVPERGLSHGTLDERTRPLLSR